MRKWLVGLVAVLTVASGCSGDSGPTEGALAGLFGIDPGVCEEEGVTSGSYFRMLQPEGDLEEGPFVPNGDSPCGDNTYTPLEPGDDGGLITDAFQEHPDRPFGADGGGAASAITRPQPWFAVPFSVATSAIDPQTEVEVSAPQISASAGTLSGDLSAFGAAWNQQHFNQGSPKPDGSTPGNTREVSGTYDPSSRRYTLQWASQIVEGPFNNFTGVWYFEGTFEERD